MKRIMIFAILGIIVVGGVLAGPLMSAVETPDYQVIQSHQNIEIRRYEPMIIAEVEVEGPRKQAIGDGFRLLADYIFGNTTTGQEIAMTAPVEQQEEVTMTAPPGQQARSWRVRFVMPSQYTIETLPQPNDQRVMIKSIASRHWAVIAFSGTMSDDNIKDHEKQLMHFVQTHEIAVTGSPLYAFYNPPWTVPMMRRNEVMIEIKP